MDHTSNNSILASENILNLSNISYCDVNINQIGDHLVYCLDVFTHFKLYFLFSYSIGRIFLLSGNKCFKL